MRVSEHRKALTSGNLDKSAVALHSAENLHSINWSEVKILDKIQDFKCRKIREAIEIVSQESNLNTGTKGGYHLSPIWAPLINSDFIPAVPQSDTSQFIPTLYRSVSISQSQETVASSTEEA